MNFFDQMDGKRAVESAFFPNFRSFAFPAAKSSNPAFGSGAFLTDLSCPKRKMPRNAAALYFFTRYVKQAGARRKLSAVPWRAGHGGMTSGFLAQVPFNEMWVKIENWRTFQEHPYAEYYMLFGAACQGKDTDCFSFVIFFIFV